jgi:cytochrome P450
MPRFQRPPFAITELDRLTSEEARTRLKFDWLCDDADRVRYLNQLGGKIDWIRSRSHVEDDPAPPRSRPVPQGHAHVALVTDAADVERALSEPENFSNIPYAELGGASFMLALDPGVGEQDIDWHKQQSEVARDVFSRFAPPQLQHAATCAVDQAAILSLRAPLFDLAEFSGQAALRYFGLLFGFSGADHGLLEEAARRGYRALQYLIVGRHFVSEASTIPLAQQALAGLSARSAALMDEYATLRRAPRTPLRPQTTRADATWPVGVQPWYEVGLSGAGEPVLQQLPDLARNLSGQDLCSLVGGLLVGTVGNVQTSICFMVEALLQQPDEVDRLREMDAPALSREVSRLLALHPPVPFLPRRTRHSVTLKGGTIPAGTDCILALRPSKSTGCPWGETHNGKPAVHGCLGRELIEPLLVELLQHTLRLPNLEQRLDALTGEVLAPERLWGTGCIRYGLRYRRDKVRVQQPLIVVMPIKAPVAENAERLRRVIRSGAPRIEWLLNDSGMVHVAWFEFMEHDTQLALRTVYDGDFDTYIQHFALRAGELFDQLFESIEGAPTMPVSEHPSEFIETIRRFNRTPLGGYFYCAYPQTTASQVPRRARRTP